MAKKSYSVEATFEGKDKVSPVMKKVGGGMGKMMTTAAAMGVAFIGVQKATQAFGAALSKVQNTMKESIKLAGEQERVEVKLAQAMKAAGIYTKEAFEANLEMASSFQKITVYGDEAVIAVQSVLASMGGLSGPIMKDAVEATMNLAATWDMDFSAAAMQIAKAAGGYTSALSRYGVMLDKSIPASEKFATALDIINTKMDKAAQAQANTWVGIVTQLGNAWDDAKEKLGDFLIKSKVVRAFLKTLTESLFKAGDALAGFRTSQTEMVEKKLLSIILLAITSLEQFAIRMAEMEKTAKEKFGKTKEFAEDFGQGLKTINKALDNLSTFPWGNVEQGVDAVTGAARRAEGGFMGLARELGAFRSEFLRMYKAFKMPSAEAVKGIGLVRASLEGLSDGLDEFAESWESMIPEDTGPTAAMQAAVDAAEALKEKTREVAYHIASMMSTATSRMIEAFQGVRGGLRRIFKGIADDFMRLVINELIKAWSLKLAGILLGGPFSFLMPARAGGEVPGHALGGIIKKFAAGGHTGLGIDSMPAMLVPGEWVVPRPAVQKHRPFLEDITREARRGYAAGGQVQPSAPVINIVINTLDTQGAVDSLRYGEFGRALQEAMNRGYYDIPGESLV